MHLKLLLYSRATYISALWIVNASYYSWAHPAHLPRNCPQRAPLGTAPRCVVTAKAANHVCRLMTVIFDVPSGFFGVTVNLLGLKGCMPYRIHL